MKQNESGGAAAKYCLPLLAAAIFFIPSGFATAQVSGPEEGADSGNMLLNPGFEQAGTNESEAFGWQTFQNGYRRIKFPHTGAWGIRLSNTGLTTMSGAYQRIDLQQEEAKPVFIGGYVSGRNIKSAPGSYFGAGIYAEVHLMDGSVRYWNSIANTGTFGWRRIGFNTGTLTVDGKNKLIDQPIDHIFVVPVLAQAKGNAYFDDIEVKEYAPREGAVTLMFDDGERSTYAEAKPILDNHGFAGSAAIITGLVGNAGYMSWEEIKALKSGGWDVSSHGLTHRDLTALSGIEAIREMYGSRQALARQGIEARSFIFPYGTYNGDILAQAAGYYASARAFEQGDNVRGTFPFEVKVRGVYNTTAEAEVQGWLSEAAANGRWEVLVFHVIAPEGNDAYYLPPDKLAAIVQAVADSGLSVVTYDQGIDMFGAKK